MRVEIFFPATICLIIEPCFFAKTKNDGNNSIDVKFVIRYLKEHTHKYFTIPNSSIGGNKSIGGNFPT